MRAGTEPSHPSMTSLAVALVVCAALIHAAWNYLMKTSGGGVAFVWLFAAVSVAVYGPLAVALAWWQGFHPDAAQLGCIAASAALHTAYYLMLDHGYRRGDLSLVYPLARATGPLLTVAVAITFLGETPSASGLAGAVAIVGGAFLLAGDPRRLVGRGAPGGVGYALATGALIAAYTVVDQRAVAALLVPPLVLDAGANAGRLALLAPLAWRDRANIGRTWRERRRAIVAVGLLCPLAYLLVLTAMRFTPLSYVAPARELSILVATFLGTRWLMEAEAGRRCLAACIMLAGIAALALA